MLGLKMLGKNINFVLNNKEKKLPRIYFSPSLSLSLSRREILGKRKKFNRCLVLGQSSLLKKKEKKKKRGRKREKEKIH